MARRNNFIITSTFCADDYRQLLKKHTGTIWDDDPLLEQFIAAMCCCEFHNLCPKEVQNMKKALYGKNVKYKNKLSCFHYDSSAIDAVKTFNKISFEEKK